MVERLGRREHFDYLRAHGSTVREGRLRVRSCPPPPGGEPAGAGVAWSIGRHHGSAVRRNRTRRRLREIIRRADSEGRLPQRWYLVSVVPTSAEPSFGELSAWMDSALARTADMDRRSTDRGR